MLILFLLFETVGVARCIDKKEAIHRSLVIQLTAEVCLRECTSTDSHLMKEMSLDLCIS